MSNQSLEALMRELRPVAEQMQRLSERVAAILPPKWEFKAPKVSAWPVTGGHLHIEKPLPAFDPDPKNEPADPAVVVTTTQGAEVLVPGAYDWGVDPEGYLTVTADSEDGFRDLAMFAANRWVAVRWAGESK